MRPGRARANDEHFAVLTTGANSVVATKLAQLSHRDCQTGQWSSGAQLSNRGGASSSSLLEVADCFFVARELAPMASVPPMMPMVPMMPVVPVPVPIRVGAGRHCEDENSHGADGQQTLGHGDKFSAAADCLRRGAGGRYPSPQILAGRLLIEDGGYGGPSPVRHFPHRGGDLGDSNRPDDKPMSRVLRSCPGSPTPSTLGDWPIANKAAAESRRTRLSRPRIGMPQRSETGIRDSHNIYYGTWTRQCPVVDELEKPTHVRERFTVGY
jgi:hypothetical protein